MGCDIHLFVQYRRNGNPPSRWLDFGGEFRLDRDYKMFSCLVDRVRSKTEGAIMKRGLPDDLTGGLPFRVFYNDIDESEEFGTISMDRAISRGHPILSYPWSPNEKYTLNSDFHSHSWLTGAEFYKAITLYLDTCNQLPSSDYIALESAIHELENGNEVRVIIGFDN